MSTQNTPQSGTPQEAITELMIKHSIIRTCLTFRDVCSLEDMIQHLIEVAASMCVSKAGSSDIALTQLSDKMHAAMTEHLETCKDAYAKTGLR